MVAKRKQPKSEALPSKDEGPSFVRQIMGAVIGGSLALGIYYAYEFGSPVVTAWLAVPQSSETDVANDPVVADIDTEPDYTQRIASRTKQILDQFGWHESAPGPEEKPQQLSRVELRRAAGGQPIHPFAQNEQDSENEEGATTPDRTAFDASILENNEEMAEAKPDTSRRLEPIAPLEVQTDETKEWKGWESDHIVASEAEALPSSGVGVWLAGSGALGMASGLRYMRKKKNG